MVGTPQIGRKVRVVVVDDTEAIRELLRVGFAVDGRFELIGEATDGEEGISVVASLQPDLVVLDRQMPNMGGVEALPMIRARAPRTAVIVYTAGGDAGVYEAALSAGALGVVDKMAGGDVTERLAEILVDHWASAEATVEVRVGPVASSAVAPWLANTRKIMAAVRNHPEIVPGVPADVLDRFDRFLDEWSSIAAEDSEFTWVARASAKDVEMLVENWTLIDRLSDEEMARLGCAWSGPEGAPFFVALSTAVLEALEAHSDLRALADRLTAAQWPSTELGVETHVNRSANETG